MGNVGALVTLVAAVHYFYMREFWVQIHASPIVYRYIDWTITVPLQMVEFYLILSAVNPDITAGMFWRLLLGTIAMLCFGYMGESKMINPDVGFFLGMCGWGFILQEIFVGEAGTVAKDIDKVSIHTQNSFNVMRFIATAGWCIYPLGYLFGYLLGKVNDDVLNLIYNLADLVNNCLLPRHLAVRQERHRREGGGPGWVQTKVRRYRYTQTIALQLLCFSEAQHA